MGLELELKSAAIVALSIGQRKSRNGLSLKKVENGWGDHQS